MKTNSLRAQMLTLSVSTVLITALTILSAFWWTTSNYTQQQVRVHIDSALKVFNQFLESRQQQLFISAEVLTSDFGFKQAVASRDNATITSALLNHGQRINADLMLLIDLEGDIVASSDETGAPGTPFNHPLLIQKTLDAGGATSFVQLGDTVFQIILLPVKAPLTIAIAGIGFRLDLSVVQHLRNLSGLNVTLISTGQGIPVTISTLAPETQPSALKSPSEVARAALLPFHQQQHFSSHKLNLESHNDSSVDVVLTEHLDEAYADFNRLGWNILTISGVTIILAILGSLLFSRGMTRPLNTLVALAEKFAKGQYIKVHTPSSVTREIGTLMNAFSKMGSEIEKREQHITYQAMHDPLTGLLNRATMLERINLLTNETGAPFVLIACNIVGFRIINDNFGPTTGDFCLRAVAQRMTHFGEKHPLLAARVSGDEFLIAISHHAEYSEQLSHALMEHLSSPMTYGEIIFTLNFRFGISRFPDDGNNASVLSRRTSIALDAARKEQVSLRHYKEGEDDAHLLRLKTISNLKQALNSDDGQLFMFYQPKKNLVTGRIEKLEALIRWIHPQEGFIAPDYFVELAEQSGQIDQLTDWVISQVLKQLAQWQQSGLSIQVAINISAHDLERESLLNNVTHQLSDLGLPHHSVSFELTERDMMQNADLAIELMGRFKKQGFSLSVDDYGIGYSSLSKLKQMPVNELKIDKSFVLQLDQSESDQIIVQSTIDLAHSFNLKVIAEGVENQATQEVLKSMGCDYIQGYYLAKPMAAADVAQWISNHEKSISTLSA
ncbi:MAG: EAL domain-containing protein [Hahellaceae bacterium]|nr:EAL domain-containing protein [Hahellaceae bacterium]